MGSPSITLSPGGGFLLEPTGSVTIFTPEMLTGEQRMIQETADDFVKREVLPRVAEIEAKKPGLMRELLQKAGAVGLLGHDVPEEYGGLGGDKTSSSLIFESASRQGSFAVSFGAHVGIGTMPIVLFGTAEQRKKYLPVLATGEKIAAYALTEPGSGSDALAAKTKAVLSPDGKTWRLTGSKQFITNAGFADLFTVFAQVDGSKFTAFLVERADPGVSTGAEEHKLGIEGSSTRPLLLDAARIPADRVLGEVGRGHKIAFNILNVGRFKLGGGALGAARECLRLAVDYGRGRVQFGKPIVSFGMVQRKIADMATRLFAADAMAYRTAGLLDAAAEGAPARGAARDEALRAVLEDYTVECSVLKVFGTECLDFVADEALQVLGGYGFLRDYPIERHFRDSRINRIFEGTNEINRLIIPATLLKRAGQKKVDYFAFVESVKRE